MQLNMAALYHSGGAEPAARLQQSLQQSADGDEDAQALQKAASGIVWTHSMRRMYTLVNRYTQPVQAPSCSVPYTWLLAFWADNLRDIGQLHSCKGSHSGRHVAVASLCLLTLPWLAAVSDAVAICQAIMLD